MRRLMLDERQEGAMSVRFNWTGGGRGGARAASSELPCWRALTRTSRQNLELRKETRLHLAACKTCWDGPGVSKKQLGGAFG